MLRIIGFIALSGALGAGAFAQAARPPAASIAALDQQITQVFREKRVRAYPHVESAYLSLLRSIDTAMSTEDRAAARRHLHYIAMVMAEGDPARPSLERLLASEDGDIEDVVSWWHRQDPLPATQNNERIQEHLARIAYALEHYAYEGHEHGVDDRGVIYIRLGAPIRSKQIKIVSVGIRMNPYSAKLPANDLWEYRQIDKEAHYLFVRSSRHKPYRIGTAEDLLPRELIASRRRVMLLIPIMEEVFAQLALAHPHYGTTYDALNSYVTVPGGTGTSPYQFARRTLNKMRLDNDFYEENRKHIIPVAYTNALRGASPLTPALRWARFLAPDGQTHVEVYWGLSTDDLTPTRRLVSRLEGEGHKPTSRYLITFAVARRNARFATEAIDTHHFVATHGRRLRTQTWSLASASPMIHLAMQWDQRWAYLEDDGNVSVGATLKMGTHSLDSLAALQADPFTLEMSDIKPLSMPPEATFEEAAVYPFAALTPTTPVALYFEVYHLTFGEDDAVHYSLEYRVESVKNQNRNPLAVVSSHSGVLRTAKEYISLDLSTWDRSEPINITVRVTDEVTGQSVERSIRFDFTL